MKKALDHAMNVAIALLLLYVCFRPGGIIRAPYEEWQSKREARHLVQESWSDLTLPTARIGSATAKQVLVEFSDFQCPFCAQAAFNVDQLVVQNPDVAVVYRHLPLTQIHPHAEAAALAAICSEEQNAFTGLYNFLFQDEEWDQGKTVDWAAVAASAHVPDAAALIECMGSSRARMRLDADIALAMKLKLTGTPSFVAPSGIQSGALPAEILLSLLGSD